MTVQLAVRSNTRPRLKDLGSLFPIHMSLWTKAFEAVERQSLKTLFQVCDDISVSLNLTTKNKARNAPSFRLFLCTASLFLTHFFFSPSHAQGSGM